MFNMAADLMISIGYHAYRLLANIGLGDTFWGDTFWRDTFWGDTFWK